MLLSKLRTYLLAGAVTVAAVTSPVLAGGLLGDFVNTVAPGVGTALDDTHRQIKRTVKPYGQAEEAVSGGVRQVTREFTVETAGPALAEWIRASRNDAVNAGVSPIPEEIRQWLRLTFKDSLLDTVYYRIGQGNELSLQANSFRFGDAAAITLEDVIVFRSVEDFNNLRLWAHELGHIQQYQAWGLNKFAKRYVRNFHDVEDDAERRAIAWEAAYNQYTANNYQSSYEATSQPQWDGRQWVVADRGQWFRWDGWQWVRF